MNDNVDKNSLRRNTIGEKYFIVHLKGFTMKNIFLAYSVFLVFRFLIDHIMLIDLIMSSNRPHVPFLSAYPSMSIRTCLLCQCVYR